MLKNGVKQERKSLKNVLEKLGGDEFMMIERGYIINLDHIDRVYSRNVVLSDGTEIRASKNCINDLKDKIQEYWIREKG